MTQENPPTDHNEEYEGKRLNFQDLSEGEQQEHLRSLERIKIQQREKEQRVERLYEAPLQKNTEIDHIATKTKELEELIPSSTEGSSLGSKEDANLEGKTIWKKAESTKENLEQKKEKGLLNFFKKYWKKAAMVTAFTSGGMLASQKASATGEPTDSLKTKTLTEKTMTPSDSSKAEKSFDIKKYEQFGISRADLLESNDPTKDILLVSIDEYKSYGEVFNILKKAGLTPSSTQTMDKMRDMNEDMFKRSGAVISLDEMVNKLGNPSYSTMTWDKKANSFHGESREIQVMKSSKKEEGSNFDSDYDRYRFIVEVPKTTVEYDSGIVKNK